MFFLFNFWIIVKCFFVVVLIIYLMIECIIIYFMILFSFKKNYDDFEIEKRRMIVLIMFIYVCRLLEF